MKTSRLPQELSDRIVACGFFPSFIEAAVASALGSDAVEASLVHHEATFDHDALHRHVTVLVLTPTRLLVAHTDDGEAPGNHQALTTVEVVPRRRLTSASVTHVVADPARWRPGQGMDEVWLTLNWGAVRRIELSPASCGDPACDADHGYDAQDVADDLTVRMSALADGDDNVARLVDFGAAIQLALA